MKNDTVYIGSLISESPDGQWAVVETIVFTTRDEAQAYGEAKLLLTHREAAPSKLIWRVKAHAPIAA